MHAKDILHQTHKALRKKLQHAHTGRCTSCHNSLASQLPIQVVGHIGVGVQQTSGQEQGTVGACSRY